MIKLTKEHARALAFLDNTWHQDKYREFFGMEGAVGWREGSSYLIGLEIDDELFVERFKFKKEEEFGEILQILKSTYQKVRLEETWSDGGFKDGMYHIRTENDKFTAFLYDSDFEPQFIGNRAVPTMEMVWSK